jgi:cephalosporin-C deacetylase
MNFKYIFLLAISVLLLLPCAGAPQTSGEGGGVTLRVAADGGLEITAPGYRARLGSDGNLHSLRAGNTELLDDKISLYLGGFYFAKTAMRLGRITLIAPSLLENVPVSTSVPAVRATDGTYTIDYLFLPAEIRLSLYHKADKPILYYLVCSGEITQAMNFRTGEIAGIPAEEPWPDVTLTAGSGSYLMARGGDRIWGPFNGRQVWELGPIKAGEVREITLSPGVGPPPQLTPAQLISLKVELSGKQPLFGAGEFAELTVNIDNRGETIPEARLDLQFNDKKGDSLAEFGQTLPLAGKGETSNRFDITSLEPGIYLAETKLFSQGKMLKEQETPLAFRPEEIKPPLNLPSDFDVFWSKALLQARSLSGDSPPEFKANEEYSTPAIKVYEVVFPGANGERLSGWLCLPNRPGPLPAILQLLGYGRPKLELPLALAERGYVAFLPNVVPETANTFYIVQGIEDPNSYYYRNLVINSVRALELLLARPEVDPRRVVLSGVAQGGGLALITAALEPEAVAAVTADFPMLCDFRRSVAEGDFPYDEIRNYLAAHPGQENQVRRTLDYYDVLNFSPKVKSPTQLSLGLKDQTCLPETIFAVYNYLTVPKEIKVYPEAGHEGGGPERWLNKFDWLDKILPPASEPATPGVEEEKPVEPAAPQPAQP